MKNENKRRICNTEAAAKKPDVKVFCPEPTKENPNGGYQLPAVCKGKVEVKCKGLCTKIETDIKELNKQCDIQAKFRIALAALLINKNDLKLGNLIQTYINIGENAADKSLGAISKYLDSNTVKGNKSVNLWNLALQNLANAKDGKVGNKDGGKDGKGKNDGGKGPKNSNKDKKDKKSNAKNNPNQHKDPNDSKSNAKNNPNNNNDKKDDNSNAKNNPHSNSGVKINEEIIIELIKQRRKDNKLLVAAYKKVEEDEEALKNAKCTTTPKPNTSLAPQDIWFSNSSAKKQKAQIKKQRQIKKKKQRQLKNKRNK